MVKPANSTIVTLIEKLSLQRRILNESTRQNVLEMQSVLDDLQSICNVEKPKLHEDGQPQLDPENKQPLFDIIPPTDWEGNVLTDELLEKKYNVFKAKADKLLP